jgi:hypothetical protein
MKGFRFTIASLAIAALCVPVFSQMNLNYFYSRGVSSGKGTCTRMDTVLIDTKVGSGVATTMLTLTMTPDLYKQCTYYSNITDSVVTWVAANKVDSVISLTGYNSKTESNQNGIAGYRLVTYTYSYGYKCPGTGESIDSIEINAGFSLPSDFVVKNLYLWVNGERQTGYIQDRALASQQYTQIVGKRRDPAILEFWGNGQYNLRIFPTKSLVSRKVAIEFQHTFNDDSLDLITASLPFQYDSANVAYAYSSDSKFPIHYLQISASATDARTYDLDLPGLTGPMNFSANAPLVLQRVNFGKLGVGSIESHDPSGAKEFLWAAPDKDKKATVGFSTMLSKSAVTLDPEPDIRVIVLDIQNETWNQNEFYSKQYQYAYPWITYSAYDGYKTIDVMLRAKKSAILCLQEYVAQNQKFNVVLTQAAGQKPVTIFESPVSPTEENLNKAFDAIVAAKVSASTSEDALHEAIAQAPKGIVIFISDLFQPYNYGKYEDNTYSKYIVSEAGQQYDSLMARMSRAVSASSGWFFTIGDEYKLTQIANTSGGYNLASLRWDSYYYRRILYSSDGQQETALQLPPLFGSYYYGQPITGLKVIASSEVEECVFTTDGYGYYYGYDVMSARAGGIMLDKKKALSKTSLLVSPYRYYGDSTMFRLAAKLTSIPYSGTIDFTITGKMGGLGFSKKISADASTIAGSFNGQEHYGLWAFRKTEQLGMTNWSLNADSIRWLGQDHHIITRQTSLLALEPGMEIWKDTINPSNPSTTDNKAGGASMDIAGPSTRMADANSVSGNIDGISLQELIAKRAPVIDTKVTLKNADVAMSFSRSALNISIPQSKSGPELAVSLYSVQGRLIMTKRITTRQGVAGAFMVRFGTKMAGKGLYIVKAKIGPVEKVLSVPVF